MANEGKTVAGELEYGIVMPESPENTVRVYFSVVRNPAFYMHSSGRLAVFFYSRAFRYSC